MPTSIDSVPEAHLWVVLLVNSLLLGAFAVQHSVMTRPGFKRWITRLIPKSAERSTYTLIAIRLEERDLLAVHPEYKGYRERGPMLMPRLKGGQNSGTPVSEAA